MNSNLRQLKKGMVEVARSKPAGGGLKTVGTIRAVVLLLMMLVLTVTQSNFTCKSLNFDVHAVTKPEKMKWGEIDIVSYMEANPNRAYFSRLFFLGGFRVGMEVGVAEGRFSEHFLIDNSEVEHWSWYMVEPYPSRMTGRLWVDEEGTAHPMNKNATSWTQRGIGRNAHKVFLRQLSTDTRLLKEFATNSFDFVYLDGAHDYETVKKELVAFYPKVSPGGVLAGHDYCNYGEKSLSCIGCDFIPKCQEYTEFGIKQGKKIGIAENQVGVVNAVQEWLVENHPSLRLYHTKETFTRESLAADGIDYDLIITSTRNPSWFVVKPDSSN